MRKISSEEFVLDKEYLECRKFESRASKCPFSKIFLFLPLSTVPFSIASSSRRVNRRISERRETKLDFSVFDARWRSKIFRGNVLNNRTERINAAKRTCHRLRTHIHAHNDTFGPLISLHGRHLSSTWLCCNLNTTWTFSKASKTFFCLYFSK